MRSPVQIWVSAPEKRCTHVRRFLFPQNIFITETAMDIRRILGNFTVCKLMDLSTVNYEAEYCFMGNAENECSLVCRTVDVPRNIVERDDGWRALRIEGVLDLSLIGVLAQIATLLAEAKISIFVVSTFNTDYIFVKKKNEARALKCLSRAGYNILPISRRTASGGQHE